MRSLDETIEQLENGTEIQDVIDAMEVIAVEVEALKEPRHAGISYLFTRS